MLHKVIRCVAMALSHRSAGVVGVTSRHGTLCRQAEQLRSLGASPLWSHLTWRGLYGCFAAAWSLSLAMDGVPAWPSVRAIQLSLMMTRFASVKCEPLFYYCGRITILYLQGSICAWSTPMCTPKRVLISFWTDTSRWACCSRRATSGAEGRTCS